MHRRLVSFSLMVAAAALAGLVIAREDPNAKAAPAIDATRLHAHVEYLASPKMKGRGAGSPELDRAAKYIAAEFKKQGLEPAFAGSYFQKFPVTIGATLGPNNRITTTGLPPAAPPAPHPRVSQDFVPLDISDSGAATLPLVFAGYGISSNEHKFDEYLHLDVRDKAVIVLRHEPQENDDRSLFAGRHPTAHSDITNKAINARLHGAKAMILVNDPVPHSGEEDRLVKLGSIGGDTNFGLLLLHASQATVNRWLAPTGKTLAQLQSAIDQKLEPQSAYIPDVKLALQIDLRRRTAPAQNVGAILRGSDPKLRDEAIVIGAHYDHLGLGERNSLAPSLAGQIHPGADDNASGAAAVLEMARAFAARKPAPQRTIVFLAFSAEELGLLGSSHYTKSPAWPLDRTAAMVNLDMVGRPRNNTLHVGGVGTSPGFQELVQQANNSSFTLSFSDSGYGSSDHTSFAMKQVPVIFFFSGLHADYHKPSDVPARIPSEDHARVVELALRAAQSLAALEAKPLYVRVAEPARPVTGGSGSGYGPYFGSIPDMGEQVEGVKFGDVREGSPAALAGFKAGDVLVEFAGKPIKNLYDFTFALRAQKPGDEVTVTVLRGAQRITAQVLLTARR